MGADQTCDEVEDEEKELVSHHGGGKITGQSCKDNRQLRIDDDSNEHGSGSDREEVGIRGGRNGDKFSAQNIGDEMEDFKEGDHSEQRATEKEEVCGRKCDLPDIFSRELIQAGQDEKSQQSQANENGKYMAPLLGFFQGIDFKEMLLLDTLPGP